MAVHKDLVPIMLYSPLASVLVCLYIFNNNSNDRNLLTIIPISCSGSMRLQLTQLTVYIIVTARVAVFSLQLCQFKIAAAMEFYLYCTFMHARFSRR